MITHITTTRPLVPTTETVAHIIRQVTGIKNLPLHEPLANLGVTSQQLSRIQIGFVKNFNRTLPTIKWGDTVQEITDNLKKVKP